MKKYVITVYYTEQKIDKTTVTVYAHNNDDAKEAARLQFIDSRRDDPQINEVKINEPKDGK